MANDLISFLRAKQYIITPESSFNINGHTVEFAEILGWGGNAVVFAGKITCPPPTGLTSEECAFKVSRATNEGTVMLEIAAHRVSWVPKVYAILSGLEFQFQGQLGNKKLSQIAAKPGASHSIIAMERLGASLASTYALPYSFSSKRPPANDITVVNWANTSRQMVQAIKALHEGNRLHCDIKLENFCLRRGSMEVVLIDYGMVVTASLSNRGCTSQEYTPAINGKTRKSFTFTYFTDLQMLVYALVVLTGTVSYFWVENCQNSATYLSDAKAHVFSGDKSDVGENFVRYLVDWEIIPNYSGPKKVIEAFKDRATRMRERGLHPAIKVVISRIVSIIAKMRHTTYAPDVYDQIVRELDVIFDQFNTPTNQAILTASPQNVIPPSAPAPVTRGPALQSITTAAEFTTAFGSYASYTSLKKACLRNEGLRLKLGALNFSAIRRDDNAVIPHLSIAALVHSQLFLGPNQLVYDANRIVPSSFAHDDLPANPGHPLKINVVKADSISDVMETRSGITVSPQKALVVSFANANVPGGEYEYGSQGLEERIVYRTNYINFLQKMRYPFTNSDYAVNRDNECDVLWLKGVTILRGSNLDVLPTKPVTTEGPAATKRRVTTDFLAVALYDMSKHPSLVAKINDEVKALESATTTQSLSAELSTYIQKTKKKLDAIFQVGVRNEYERLIIDASDVNISQNNLTIVALIFKSLYMRYHPYFRLIGFPVNDDTHTTLVKVFQHVDNWPLQNSVFGAINGTTQPNPKSTVQNSPGQNQHNPNPAVQNAPGQTQHNLNPGVQNPPGQKQPNPKSTPKTSGQKPTTLKSILKKPENATSATLGQKHTTAANSNLLKPPPPAPQPPLQDNRIIQFTKTFTELNPLDVRFDKNNKMLYNPPKMPRFQGKGFQFIVGDLTYTFERPTCIQFTPIPEDSETLRRHKSIYVYESVLVTKAEQQKPSQKQPCIIKMREIPANQKLWPELNFYLKVNASPQHQQAFTRRGKYLIPRFYVAFADQHFQYLVLEKVEGKPMLAKSEENTFDVNGVVGLKLSKFDNITADVVHVIAALYNEFGFAYGDLDLDSILVQTDEEEEARAVMIGFGLVRKNNTTSKIPDKGATFVSLDSYYQEKRTTRGTLQSFFNILAIIIGISGTFQPILWTDGFFSNYAHDNISKEEAIVMVDKFIGPLTTPFKRIVARNLFDVLTVPLDDPTNAMRGVLRAIEDRFQRTRNDFSQEATTCGELLAADVNFSPESSHTSSAANTTPPSNKSPQPTGTPSSLLASDIQPPADPPLTSLLTGNASPRSTNTQLSPPINSSPTKLQSLLKGVIGNKSPTAQPYASPPTITRPPTPTQSPKITPSHIIPRPPTITQPPIIPQPGSRKAKSAQFAHPFNRAFPVPRQQTKSESDRVIQVYADRAKNIGTDFNQFAFAAMDLLEMFL